MADGRSGKRGSREDTKGIQMKKILVALLVGAFGISAMAQSIVYDYKATVKRVDPQYKVRTIKGSSSSYKAVTESYGIASDTISGYVVLPVCEDCDGDLETSLDRDDFVGTAYLVRKGDKLSKKAGKPFIAVTDAEARAAIFGKDAYIVGYPSNGNPSDVKNLKSAWMWMWVELPGATDTDPDTVIDSGLLIPAAPGENVYLGFLGLDNLYEYSCFRSTGFGTAKILSYSEAASLGFCDGAEASSWSCAIIQSISGTVQGEYFYEGLCGVTPMWDLCDPTDDGNTGYAPVTGAWTLKYNASLSKLPDSEKADAILKKLKATSADVIQVEAD